MSVKASAADKALLEHFVSNCLRLYKLALPLGANLPASERRPGDDAAILAAMGCVHLYSMGEERALLRAAVILEVMLANSMHNYDALLLIIRIHFCLGAVSEGIAHYLKLDIKHIQYLTNSWVLFTRISTLHPQPVQSSNPGSDSSLSPAYLLSRALSWTDKNDILVETGVKKFMEYDSLVNLLKHLDYAKISGQAPMIKHQFMVEMQRISRLGHSKPEPKIKFPLGTIALGSAVSASEIRLTSFQTHRILPFVTSATSHPFRITKPRDNLALRTTYRRDHYLMYVDFAEKQYHILNADNCIESLANQSAVIGRANTSHLRCLLSSVT